MVATAEHAARTTLLEIRSVVGGVLVQDRDRKPIERRRRGKWSRNARRPKTECEAMLFGWRVVKHVKSNAIVYAAADRTLGIGAGQMSRVDSLAHRDLESGRGGACR